LHRGDFFGAAIRVGAKTDQGGIYGAWCLGRIVVPLIPVIGFAGPPTLGGPTPGRATLVPLIVPRLSVEDLTFGFAFDGGCPSAPPGLATPPLLFAPKPVGAPTGLLPRGCSALPCSMPPGRATDTPIASRETRP